MIDAKLADPQAQTVQLGLADALGIYLAVQAAQTPTVQPTSLRVTPEGLLLPSSGAP